MSLTIVDAVILLLLFLGGVVGLKKGFITELTSFLGTFLIVILAFMFRKPLATLLCEVLPFIKLGGAVKGFASLNVIIYELLAFFIILIVLIFLLRGLLLVTGLVERLVKMIVFLNLPSKILGFIVGIFAAYIYLFIALLVLTMPIFNLTIIEESNLANKILNTPILSNVSGNYKEVYNEIYDVLDDTTNKTGSRINEEILTILLDKEVITIETADKLISGNKIEVENSNFIEDYQKGETNGLFNFG